MIHPTMTVTEAAGYLQVKPRTVRDWIAAGKLQANRVGKKYVIPIEVVSSMVNTPNTVADEVSSLERKVHARKLLELLSCPGDREKGRASVLAARERDMGHRNSDRRRL